MKARFITLTKENIENEHICCAFSDKKCVEGYALKKEWLKEQIDNGYVFRRLDERAKVFIEYVPAEKSWSPIKAPNYLMINCFWVSGQYKDKGYGKTLLQSAADEAEKDGRDGIVTVVGTKKFHFMSDTKWLLSQGFKETEKTKSGFSLLALKINNKANNPSFKECVLSGECENKNGITIYYTNRCPFTEYYINECLTEACKNKNIPLKIIKLNTMKEAQSAPTPATIFSMFHNGKFVTTDLSVCLEKRLLKLLSI